MAHCLIVENPDMGSEQADQVYQHLRTTGPMPPEGARLVLTGQADSGRRIITIWDSEKARERFFAERLAPAYAEAGLSLDRIKRTVFEVETLIAGDLTGTPA
jgi:hypothetical protein